MLPSGPAVIPYGCADMVGRENSVMAPLWGSIIAIWPAVCSVNQRLPSGPVVIATGVERGEDRENSAMLLSKQRGSSGSRPGACLLDFFVIGFRPEPEEPAPLRARSRCAMIVPPDGRGPGI